MAKLGVVAHNLAHQLPNHLLPDDPTLLARQFCDCLRDRINDIIGFIGIDLVRPGCCRIFGKEVVDQFDHHTMEAGSFLVFSLSCH